MLFFIASKSKTSSWTKLWCYWAHILELKDANAKSRTWRGEGDGNMSKRNLFLTSSGLSDDMKKKFFEVIGENAQNARDGQAVFVVDDCIGLI